MLGYLVALFAGAAWVLVPPARAVEWDEAVYISQVAPWAIDIGWREHRALGLTWLVAPAVMLSDSVIALRLWVSGRRGAIASALVSAPYLLYTGATAPRFLLPAFALASICAGAGLLRLVRLLPAAAHLATLTLVLVGLVRLQVPTAIQIGKAELLKRSEAQEIAKEISELLTGGECLFLSRYSYPQISLATGCEGKRLTPDDLGSQENLYLAVEALLKRSNGGEAAVVTWFGADDFGVFADWSRHDFLSVLDKKVTIYFLSSGHS